MRSLFNCNEGGFPATLVYWGDSLEKHGVITLYCIFELGKPSTNTLTSIILADDHQIVLDGLKGHVKLNEAYDLVATATDGRKCFDLCRSFTPDLVIADIDMPMMNGMELTRRIKAELEGIKVIILTFHNEQSIIKKLVENGADGYLLKNSEMAELDTAIAKVMSGQKYFSSEVTMSLLQGHELKRSPVTEDISQKLSELSEREVDVLKGIADGLSNKKIADRLFISHKTVDSHRTNLMKKLEAHNVAKLIKFAIKAGLVE